MNLSFLRLMDFLKFSRISVDEIYSCMFVLPIHFEALYFLYFFLDRKHLGLQLTH